MNLHCDMSLLFRHEIAGEAIEFLVFCFDFNSIFLSVFSYINQSIDSAHMIFRF